VLPIDPVFLRVLRTTGVVARLGLIQRAGRLEGGLISSEAVRASEDDFRFSIVLVLAFGVLSWRMPWHDYITMWDPLLEIVVYGIVILAVRAKVRRNVERLRQGIMNPLQRLNEQNRDKLVTLLGVDKAGRITEEIVEQFVRGGKNEIDLIVEQVDLIFAHIRKFVSERTLRESRGEVVIPPGQPIAMSFSDIEGFTNATQAMQASIIPVLGRYLRTMSEQIIRHGGDIEKFIGDAVFSFHYDAARPEDSCNRSFDSVLDCVRTVRGMWNSEEWKALFAGGDWLRFKDFRTRYGMHYGPVTAGPIGSLEEQVRVESTLVGDHVNTTSRLEGLAKHYGLYNLMSEDFYDQLSADRQARCRLVDFITVMGREDQPFRVYTVDYDPLPEAFLVQYGRALDAYFAGQWDQALTCFRAAQQHIADDGPTHALMDRIEESKRDSIMAMDNISRKIVGQFEMFDALRRHIEQAIESEPYLPPQEFTERGGYWRWEEK